MENQGLTRLPEGRRVSHPHPRAPTAPVGLAIGDRGSYARTRIGNRKDEGGTMKHIVIGMLAFALLAIPEAVSAQPTASSPPAVSTGHTGSQTRAHHRRHAVQSAKSKSTAS